MARNERGPHGGAEALHLLAHQPFADMLFATVDTDVMVEGLNATLPTARSDVRRSSSADFRLEGVNADRLSILRMTRGAVDLDLHITYDPDTVESLSILVPVAGAFRVATRSPGRPVTSFRAEAGHTALITGPGAEVVLGLEPDAVDISILLDLTDLRRFAARVLTTADDQIEDLDFDPELSEPAVVQSLLAHLRMLQFLTTPDTNVPGARSVPVNPLMLPLVREQILTTLLLGAEHTRSDDLRRGIRGNGRSGSRSAIGDARDAIVARAGDAVSIEAIAREVGLTLRGLHAGFRREFGVSPKQFLTQVRLDAARAELLSADADVRVAEIGRRWGYAQPSRFAAAYRARFGELPSATRSGAGPGRTTG